MQDLIAGRIDYVPARRGGGAADREQLVKAIAL